MRRKERTHVPTRTNVAEPAHPMGNVVHETDGAAPRVNVPSRTKTHVIRWDRNADGMKAKHPPKDEPKRSQGKRTFLGGYVRQHVHLQTARHERWEARDTLHPRLSLHFRSCFHPPLPSGPSTIPTKRRPWCGCHWHSSTPWPNPFPRHTSMLRKRKITDPNKQRKMHARSNITLSSTPLHQETRLFPGERVTLVGKG